jgi:hypothetical protein
MHSYEVVYKIFQTDAVKIIKLPIRPTGRCHHTCPTISSIFGMLPGGPLLSVSHALSAIRPGFPKWYQTSILSASILLFEIGSHRVLNHRWRPWTTFRRQRRADEVQCRRRRAAASPQVTYMTPNKRMWKLPT